MIISKSAFPIKYSKIVANPLNEKLAIKIFSFF
jgi:hypothetical protein